MRPMLLTYIAEQQLRAEHFADSIGTLNQAAEEVRTGASRFYEPEIVRLGGEILLRNRQPMRRRRKVCLGKPWRLRRSNRAACWNCEARSA